VAGRQQSEFAARTFSRAGLDTLPAHLERSYRIRVARLTELDVGVYRVERRDGPDWVVRVFPASRPVEAADGDGAILRFLADHGFPAEQCAATPAVTVHEGQPVLVTEFVAGTRPHPGEQAFFQLGDLLGRLHTLPPGPPLAQRDGGGWHHLVPSGGPRAEIDAAAGLIETLGPDLPAGQRDQHAGLLAELQVAEDGHGLPEALLHPDFVPVNVISGVSGPVLVDWTGAGRGPRLWSLAFLLWAAGVRDLGWVNAVVAGYRAHVQPEPAELDRLAGAIAVRPLIFECWHVGVGHKELPAVTAGLPGVRDLAGRIAAHAVEAFADPTLASRATRLAAEPAGVSIALPEGVGTTALAVAAVRAAESQRSDRMFSDPLADAFVTAADWRPGISPERQRARLRFWILARTVFLDELLASAAASGCRQVVLLGAGFDTRAFRLDWPAGTRCFELDTADVLDAKGRVLAAAAAEPACERIPVAADLCEDWPGALTAAGFDRGQPTVWIAEGLLVYLTAEAVETLLADLTALSAPGSRMGLTMTTRSQLSAPTSDTTTDDATTDGVASDGAPESGAVSNSAVSNSAVSNSAVSNSAVSNSAGNDGAAAGGDGTGDGGRRSLLETLRRSGAPDDPVAWLAGHGWDATLSNAYEVMAAHGRPARSAAARDPARRPSALLIEATRGH